MTHFEFPSDPGGTQVHGECLPIDDTSFQVKVSVKIPGYRRQQARGKVSMSYLREPAEHEEERYGVILPKRWLKTKTDIYGRDVYSIFRNRGDALDWFTKKLAAIMGKGKIDCYVGLLPSGVLMPVDTERCEKLKKAREFLSDLYSFEVLHDIVVESYKRYLKYAADLSIDNAVEFMPSRKPTDIAPIFRTATIECTAFLSLFRLYWETLAGDSREKRQRFFALPEAREVLENAVREISPKARNTIDRLVKGLCPLALHGRPIADFLSWGSRNDENDYYRWFTSFLEIKTSKKIPPYLRDTAQSYLENNPPMNQSLAEGLDELSGVHLAIRDALKGIAANARSSIEAGVEEWKEHASDEHSETDIDNLFTIYERNRGCGLNQQETFIGLSHDKNTRLLEYKYRRTPAFAKLTVETIERYLKVFLHEYKIVLLGRFPDRSELVGELEKRGAVVADSLSGSVDMVIKAGKLTDRQQREVLKHQVLEVSYDLIVKLIDKSTPPDAPKHLSPRSAFGSREEHFQHILEHYGVDREK